MPVVSKPVMAAQTQQFFYRGAQSGRPADVLSASGGENDFSSEDEVETEGERQIRLQKSRAEMLKRIQQYKKSKWKNKEPSIKLPASKVKLFAKIGPGTAETK